MKKRKWITESTNELFSTILKINTIDEAQRFFRDLLTEQEILEFANRWQVARMLSEKISYVTIEKQTGMSSTTIARVNKYLTGNLEGYKLMINRTKQNKKHHLPA